MQKSRNRPVRRKSSSAGGRRTSIRRVVLADDHPMVRDALRSLLGHLPDINIVGEAATGLQAVKLAVKHEADLVIMDVSMPDLDGIEATRRLLAANAKAKVIALSASSEKVHVRGMLQAGASGYVLKTDHGRNLLAAIAAVMAGERWLPKNLQRFLTEESAKSRKPAPKSELRPREREVLRMLADGRSNKQIAAKLGISVRTVESHRSNITSKLGLRGLAELTKYALRHGLTGL